MKLNQTAINIYNYVKDLPIIDYHCHLSADEIFEDKPFENITQIWLSADHYKWRQMRTFGFDEHYITGQASDFEKFEKYMLMLSYAIGSPLYAWSKNELAFYFDVEDEILPENIKMIYDKANKAIKDKKLSPRKCIEMSNVEAVYIIENADANLDVYDRIKLNATVLPILRGDKLFELDYEKLVNVFPSYVENFVRHGALTADFGTEFLDDDRVKKLKYMVSKCYEKGLVVQLHFGAMRNNNYKMFEKIGVDKGFDSISNKPYIDGLIEVLNVENLGKTIIFNLNPTDNATLSTLCGNFVGKTFGRVQLGAAWWFNDNFSGMMEQLVATCNFSLLVTFVGMLTDSRSFISYPRHDYFRQILCKFIGEIVENGDFTANQEILKEIATRVCYKNAKDYFNID